MWLGARHAPPAARNAPRLRRPPCRSHSGPPAQPSAAAAPAAALEPQHAAPSRERARRHVVGQVAGQHHPACRGAWGGGASLVRVILGCVSDALDLGGAMGHSPPPAVTSNSKRDPSFPRPVAAPAWIYVTYREARGFPLPHTPCRVASTSSRATGPVGGGSWPTRGRASPPRSRRWSSPSWSRAATPGQITRRRATQHRKHHCCRGHPRGAHGRGPFRLSSSARAAPPSASSLLPFLPWRGAGTLEPVLNSR